MVYRSKIGLIIFIPFIIMAVLAVIFIITEAWGGLSIIILAGLFAGYLFRNTYYTITGNQLLVRSGFLINLAVPIAGIKKIAGTKSILSAPALSLDRIEVFYDTYDSVVISPKDKDGFIAALKAINDKIEID